MALANIHALYYSELRKQKRDLVYVSNIDFFVQKAMDDPEPVGHQSKKWAHEEFIIFQERFLFWSKKANWSARFESTLKYYWINHLAVDMVHNLDKKFIPNWDGFFKLIADLGEPYNSYGLNFLESSGVLPKHIRNEVIDRKKRLLVEKRFKIDFKRIKQPYPLNAQIKRDYLMQLKQRKGEFR